MSKPVFTTIQYTKDLFQESLITGVPQIFLTPNVARKILKSLVLSCCLIGFVYQTTVFLKIFWNYPTVLDIDVEYPELIEPPAITYCNTNGIKRIQFCDNYPDHCEFPKSMREFCKNFPDICNLNDQKDLKFPVEEAFHFEENIENGYLKKFGHLSNKTLMHCNKLKEKDIFEKCSTKNTIHMMMSTGTTGYRNCYTILSSIDSLTLNNRSLPVPKRKEPLFHMVWDMEPKEYFRPDREVGIVVGIHSPSSLVNPFYEGFVIKPGRLYTVHLKMVEEKLLPSPYETQCQDYKSMWKMRGGKGPLNQEMCVAECVYNASLEQCNCVLPDIMYHHDDRICHEDELDGCFHFNVSDCYTTCQQPCEFTDFEYDVQERKLELAHIDSIEELPDWEWMGKSRAVMLVFLKRPEIIIYSHRPQYEDIEVFSFLGGYIGMWLGVSLIAVFDFLESLFLIICFWIRKKL